MGITVDKNLKEVIVGMVRESGFKPGFFEAKAVEDRGRSNRGRLDKAQLISDFKDCIGITFDKHPKSKRILLELVRRHSATLTNGNDRLKSLSQIVCFLKHNQDSQFKISLLEKLCDMADSCGDGFLDRLIYVASMVSSPENIKEVIASVRSNLVNDCADRSMLAADEQSVHGHARLKSIIHMAGLHVDHNKGSNGYGGYNVPDSEIKKLKEGISPDAFIDLMLDKCKSVIETSMKAQNIDYPFKVSDCYWDISEKGLLFGMGKGADFVGGEKKYIKDGNTITVNYRVDDNAEREEYETYKGKITEDGYDELKNNFSCIAKFVTNQDISIRELFFVEEVAKELSPYIKRDAPIDEAASRSRIEGIEVFYRVQVNWDYVRELLIKEINHKKFFKQPGYFSDLIKNNTLVGQLNTHASNPGDQLQWIYDEAGLENLALRACRLNVAAINKIAVKAADLKTEGINKLVERVSDFDEESLRAVAGQVNKITSIDAIYAMARKFVDYKVGPSSIALAFRDKLVAKNQEYTETHHTPIDGEIVETKDTHKMSLLQLACDKNEKHKISALMSLITDIGEIPDKYRFTHISRHKDVSLPAVLEELKPYVNYIPESIDMLDNQVINTIAKNESVLDLRSPVITTLAEHADLLELEALNSVAKRARSITTQNGVYAIARRYVHYKVSPSKIPLVFRECLFSFGRHCDNLIGRLIAPSSVFGADNKKALDNTIASLMVTDNVDWVPPVMKLEFLAMHNRLKEVKPEDTKSIINFTLLDSNAINAIAMEAEAISSKAAEFDRGRYIISQLAVKAGELSRPALNSLARKASNLSGRCFLDLIAKHSDKLDENVVHCMANRYVALGVQASEIPTEFKGRVVAMLESLFESLDFTDDPNKAINLLKLTPYESISCVPQKYRLGYLVVHNKIESATDDDILCLPDNRCLFAYDLGNYKTLAKILREKVDDVGSPLGQEALNCIASQLAEFSTVSDDYCRVAKRYESNCAKADIPPKFLEKLTSIMPAAVMTKDIDAVRSILYCLNSGPQGRSNSDLLSRAMDTVFPNGNVFHHVCSKDQDDNLCEILKLLCAENNVKRLINKAAESDHFRGKTPVEIALDSKNYKALDVFIQFDCLEKWQVINILRCAHVCPYLSSESIDKLAGMVFNISSPKDSLSKVIPKDCLVGLAGQSHKINNAEVLKNLAEVFTKRVHNPEFAAMDAIARRFCLLSSVGEEVKIPKVFANRLVVVKVLNRNLLFKAILSGDLDSVKAILHCLKSYPSELKRIVTALSRTNRKFDALSLACEKCSSDVSPHKHLLVLEELVKNADIKDLLYNIKPSEGDKTPTPVDILLGESNYPALDVLLKVKYDFDIKESTKLCSESTLRELSDVSVTKLVNQVVEQPGEIKKDLLELLAKQVHRMNDKDVLIKLAKKSGGIEDFKPIFAIAKRFMDLACEKADIPSEFIATLRDRKVEGSSLLHAAISEQEVASVKAVLHCMRIRPENLSVMVKGSNKSVFQEACDKPASDNCTEILEALLGAVDIKDAKGERKQPLDPVSKSNVTPTPLALALENKNYKALDVLLQHDALLDEKDIFNLCDVKVIPKLSQQSAVKLLKHIDKINDLEVMSKLALASVQTDDRSAIVDATNRVVYHIKDLTVLTKIANVFNNNGAACVSDAFEVTNKLKITLLLNLIDSVINKSECKHKKKLLKNQKEKLSPFMGSGNLDGIDLQTEFLEFYRVASHKGWAVSRMLDRTPPKSFEFMKTVGKGKDNSEEDSMFEACAKLFGVDDDLLSKVKKTKDGKHSPKGLVTLFKAGGEIHIRTYKKQKDDLRMELKSQLS